MSALDHGSVVCHEFHRSDGHVRQVIERLANPFVHFVVGIISMLMQRVDKEFEFKKANGFEILAFELVVVF